MDAYGREVMFGMKRIQQNQSQRICRCVAGFLLTFAAVLPTLSASAESDLAAYMRGKMFRMWVNDDAGWSFNSDYDNLLSHMNPTNAAELSDSLICTNSFFGLFDERGLYGTNGSFLATQPAVRIHALADGIPAESYAAGANRIEHGSAWENRNVNMPNTARASWLALYGEDMSGNPTESWKHSDIKNRPYQVVREVFLSIVEKGSLR